jgi:hypothetical protein
MAGSTFKTNPYRLHELLLNCHRGTLQLPDFQRSWVWDEDRIKSLIASVSKAFPVGALMTLETGGEVDFKPRPVEGAPAAAADSKPQSLLLDGQQRMTSLYQVGLRGKVVETITSKKKKVRRWFYIDINKALDATVDRDEAIVAVPEDKKVTKDFGRVIDLDLTTKENEFKSLMYPLSEVFDWDDWQDGFDNFWSGAEHEDIRKQFRQFKKEVLENFKNYDVPVIALGAGTILIDFGLQCRFERLIGIVGAGESCFGFIERLCRFVNLHMLDDGRGTMLAFRGSQGDAGAQLQEGVNILRARLLLQVDDHVESYTAVGQQSNPASGDAGRDVSATAACSIVGKSVGGIVKFACEDSSNPGFVQHRVNHQVDYDKMKTVDGMVTVQGWFAPDGDLWWNKVTAPATIIAVNSPMLIPEGSMEFGIKEVIHRQSSAEGTTTDIMLTNKLGMGAAEGYGK